MKNVSLVRKLSLATLVVVELLLAYWAFRFEGKVISGIGSITDYSQMLILLILPFAIFKLLALCFNALHSNLTSYWALKFWEMQETEVPLKLSLEKSQNRQEIFQNITERAPRYYSNSLTMLRNQSLFVFSAVLSILSFWGPQMTLGLSVFSLLACGTWLSHRLWQQSYSHLLSENETATDKFNKWFHNYLAHPELSQLWKNEKTSWIRDRFQEFSRVKMRVFKFTMRNNFISQWLIELPYLLSFGVFAWLMFTQQLPLYVLFVWMGVSQYVIRSVQGLIENLRLKRENNALALILKKNETDNSENINDRLEPLRTVNTKQISFNLSGVEIKISSAAGLSVIHAPNGSGKSTLLRSLCSLQESNSFVEQSKLVEARNFLFERGCYYLSPSAPCFEEFKGFLAQVLGPQKTLLNTHKAEKIYNEMSKRLPFPIVERWRVVLEKLNEKYPENNSAQMTLSAGEGNLLAWFRLWADFPEKIDFLFLDEAFSSLDASTLNLCRETLLALSSDLRIVYVTHDRFVEWNQLPHWNRGYFLACSEDEVSGFCLPYWLRSTLGYGVIDARGSIATKALGLSRRVLKTLCEVDPTMEDAKQRNFTLYCEFPEYDVGETDSAALSLAISFQNLMRSMNFKPLISRTAGTAQIDLDGDFHGVIGAEAKRRASERLGLRVLTQEDVASFQSLASL